MMGEYKVKQGETLEAIVAREAPGVALQTVLDDPANEPLFQARQADQLRPGDVVHLPDETPEDTSHTIATGQRHKFIVALAKRKFKLRVCVKGGEPYRSIPYKLDIEGQVIEGTTDSNGMVEADIPPAATEGTLTIDEQERTLQVGALDPIHTKTGIQARLNNLGYPLGKVDGIFGRKTVRAIMSFQHNNKLAVDGVVGPITRGKLKERHGC